MIEHAQTFALLLRATLSDVCSLNTPISARVFLMTPLDCSTDGNRETLLIDTVKHCSQHRCAPRVARVLEESSTAAASVALVPRRLSVTLLELSARAPWTLWCSGRVSACAVLCWGGHTSDTRTAHVF